MSDTVATTETLDSDRETRGAVRRLGVNTTLYTFGNLLTKSINFFLMLVLSWILAPEDYGIWGVAVSACNLLGVMLGLGLENAITQMHVQYSADERRSLYGTLLAFWLAVPGLAVLTFDLCGQAGWMDFIPSLPFTPYLSLVVWTSYLTVFITAPQTIFMTRQQPQWVVGLAVGQTAVTAGLVLLFTVVYSWGVVGVLFASMLSAAIMAGISISLMLRMSSWRMSWDKLGVAMRFSLPLVPHSAANWAMNLSDRFIMDHYVPGGLVTRAQIGHYNLGFQFGLLVSTCAMSVNNALFPIVNACLHDPEKRAKVPPLGTYALFAICLAGLGVASLGGEIIRIVTPVKYHNSTVVVPWIALAFVFQGLYFVWSRGTWFSMKTGWMPVITGFAGCLSVGLNFWLIPKFGIVAAGINMVIALAVLALLNGCLAAKTFPIPWEYRRWVKLFAAGLICYGVGAFVCRLNPFANAAVTKTAIMYAAVMNAAIKSSIVVAGFPALLAAMGFFTVDEWRVLRTRARNLVFHGR